MISRVRKVRHAVSAMVAACALAATPAQAQFGGIVYDPTNYAMQLAQWGQQFQQMIQQIQTAQSQLTSLTGARGLATILNNPAFQQVLPQQWQQVTNAILTGGTNGLTGPAQALYKQLLVYDSCGSNGGAATTQAQSICQAHTAMTAQRLSDMSSSLQNAQSQVSQIQSLMNAAGQTQDPKAIAEVQARIQGEQAMLANLQLQLQLTKMQNDEQDKSLQQQQQQLVQQQRAVSSAARVAALRAQTQAEANAGMRNFGLDTMTLPANGSGH
jgi:type IV secretion system protein VirB5